MREIHCSLRLYPMRPKAASVARRQMLDVLDVLISVNKHPPPPPPSSKSPVRSHQASKWMFFDQNLGP